jgi:PAS domain S-box-containing protein
MLWAFEAFRLQAATLLMLATALAWVRRKINHSEHLQAALDDIDHGVLLLDAEDRILLWNRQLERLRSRIPGTLRAGLPLTEYLVNAHPYRVGSQVVQVEQTHLWAGQLSAGAHLSSDIELDNGTLLHARALRLDNGETLITYRDIGPIKRSQLAFRDMATRLAATLDNVLDAIITINDRGIIDSFSAGAEQMFGYPSSEVIGQNIKLLMPDSHALAHDGYLEAYRRTGVPHIMRQRREVEARTKFGRVFPIELGVSEIRVGGRRLFIGIIRDITERRHVERLQQDFVAAVSHELRTPLTSVIGSLSLMGRIPGDHLGPVSQRLLTIGAQNGRRLQQLIDDILDAAKCNAESLIVNLEQIAVGPVVVQSVRANQTFAERFNVQLLIVGADADAYARVDAGRLEQVLSNLITNAVKFTSSGDAVTVELKTTPACVILEVRDHGPGIPEGFRPFVFQKFSQADSSDSRPRGGTGLGLYIARTLVERMSGQIEFESAPGSGTTFRVTLPAVQGRVGQGGATHAVYGDCA